MIAEEIVSTTGSRAALALKALASMAGSVYPTADWDVRDHEVPWTDENRENLWQHELREPDRELLEHGPGKAGYFTWLGDMHHLLLTVTSKHLFLEKPIRDNAGWRLAFLSLPAPEVFAVGLAHHYQGTPAQKRLAEVSNFLYELLSKQLVEEGKGLDLSDFGRTVKREDWDGGGLTEPDQVVAGVKFPGRLPLRLARNTTTKKVLSSWITVQKIAKTTTDDQLRLLMDKFRPLISAMVS